MYTNCGCIAKSAVPRPVQQRARFAGTLRNNYIDCVLRTTAGILSISNSSITTALARAAKIIDAADKAKTNCVCQWDQGNRSDSYRLKSVKEMRLQKNYTATTKFHLEKIMRLALKHLFASIPPRVYHCLA